MSHSTQTTRKMPSRGIALLAMTFGLTAALITAVADPHPDPVPDASVEEVARQIVDIQQELGGSIVNDSTQDGIWGLNSPLVNPVPQTMPTASSRQPVSTLREAAWQLDVTAHRLELAELYGQADALRELAFELRQDARNLKREEEKRESLSPAPPASVD